MSAPAKFAAAPRPASAARCRSWHASASPRCTSRQADAEQPPRPAETGIVTERDVLRALAETRPRRPRRARIGDHEPPARRRVRPQDFVYRAIGRMSRLRTRHLGVTDEAGRVCGALSARDLLRLRAEDAVMLGDELDAAEDVHGLGRAWSKLPQVAAGLLRGRRVRASMSPR